MVKTWYRKPGTKFRFAVLVAATAPSSWLLLFASYVVRARFALGRWPLPYRPDPSELGFHLHHFAVLLGFPMALVLCLAAILAAWALRSVSRGWAASISVLSVLSASTTFTIARANPGYLFAWFMD